MSRDCPSGGGGGGGGPRTCHKVCAYLKSSLGKSNYLFVLFINSVEKRDTCPGIAHQVVVEAVEAALVTR